MGERAQEPSDDRVGKFLERLSRPGVIVWATVLGVLLMAPALATGWVLDDFTHRVMLDPRTPEWAARGASTLYEFFPNSDAFRQHTFESGYFPWFTDPGIYARFFRPLSSLSIYLDHHFWPNWPALAHARSLLWFGALCGLVGLLFRRLLNKPMLAGLAMLIFAIDESHGGAVAWVANRHAIIASTLSVAVLLLHVRWRQDGCRRSALLAPLMLAIALCSSEMALCITAYLFAYAVWLDEGSLGRRALTLLPYALLCVGWRIGYRALGYGAGASDLYTDPLSEPLRFALATAERLPKLLAAQLTPFTSELAFFFPKLRIGALVFSVARLIIIALLLRKRVPASPTLKFCVAGMVIGALPLCAAFAADRQLLLVGIGGSVLIADLVGQLLEQRSPMGEPQAAAAPWTRGLKGLAWFWVGAHLIYAPLILPLRAYSLKVLGAAYLEAGRSLNRVGDLTGRTLVVVHAADFFWAAPVPAARLAEGLSVPDRLRILATGISAVTISREDERTIVIRSEGGIGAVGFDKLLRHPSHPLKVGDTIAVSDMSVQVLALSSEGRPQQIRVVANRPLQQPPYLWVHWARDGYRPFTLPAVGASLKLPPIDPSTLFFYRYAPDAS